VEPTNLNAMERGDEGVSLERARRLANALGVTLDYFFGDDTKVLEEVDPFLLVMKSYTSSLSQETKNAITQVVKIFIDNLQSSANTH
ncbi:MAG: helix-turn-helix domain-containing protein, partial [Defluviitaleaceae bacterium]|nr:helix-turn-helix domain-containing protein [Defluviitaleaceae bacterium]